VQRLFCTLIKPTSSLFIGLWVQKYDFGFKVIDKRTLIYICKQYLCNSNKYNIYDNVMKNRKITCIILCIAILVTTISGIGTAAGIKAEYITVDKDNDYGYGTSIDSNIHLTSKHLPLFRKSVGHIDVPQIKEFIQQVIHALEVKGNVDSNDVEEIVNILNLNAKIKGIHFLCLLRSTGFGTAYARGVLPLIFEFVFHYLFIDETYIGPAILVDWDSPNANTYINSRKIYDDDSQKGYIFGFLGLTLAGGTWPCYYNVIGFSTFVIITDLDSINENINNNGS